jgi:hypothetical protein
VRERILACLALLPALLAAAPASAVDHNNIDAGRPLRFEDAESIAFREQALELGLELAFPRHRAVGLAAHAEYLYGFALDSHAGIGFAPSIGGRAGSRDTSFDVGDVSLGVFHNFNREYGNTPAFAVRGDVILPTGDESSGTELRLRGIASKTVRQYGRLHLNVDLEYASDAEEGERELRPGIVVGYSHPLGYPRRFDRTGLAELALEYGPESGTGPVLSVGAGFRQQVTVRSVLDLGLQSDIASSRGAPRDRLRLIAGYSTAF